LFFDRLAGARAFSPTATGGHHSSAQQQQQQQQQHDRALTGSSFFKPQWQMATELLNVHCELHCVLHALTYCSRFG